MKHATITKNTASPVTGTHYTDANGVQHDLRAIRGWSREDKAVIGLYEVERQPVPEGHEATGWTLQPGEGVVLEVPTLREVTAQELLEAERAAMVCSAYQARTALRREGLIEQVQAAVDQADPEVQDAWEYATEFRRNSPTIETLATALGMDDEQLDDLFRAAMVIEA